MTAAARWHGVDVGEADLPEVRALFAQVFGTDLSPALWHWKYAGGRGLATGTRSDSGPLLAHYGGTARTVLMRGTPMGCVQVGDVMVAPQMRGILSRSGPFATAARRFIEGHIGTPHGFACGFGFPNDRAARVGERLGLYQPACAVQQWRWPLLRGLDAGVARWRWRLEPLDWSNAQTDPRLDAQWQAMAAALGQGHWALPERNAAWWRHRFANHPHGSYRCLWVRRRASGRVLGAVALRPAVAQGDPWELLDWLALPRHTGAVLTAARMACARLGSAPMLAWMSEPLVQAVLPPAMLAQASAETACTAIWSVRRAPQLCQPASTHPLRWWLTGGDTDFR